MPLDRRVMCVIFLNPLIPEHIVQIGGNHLLMPWRELMTDAADQINAGSHTYYTLEKGVRVEVKVEHRNGSKFLTTSPDEFTPNNLLSLPQCS